MGNLSAIHVGTGERRSALERKSKVCMNDDYAQAKEGIQIIGTEKYCDFSGKSDACIHVITWNMNGQVAVEDLERLVGNDRKFDLLVVGLQEAPRKNISMMLKEALSNTHMLWRLNQKKGAVAVRIRYKGISMAFISCHLAAHASNVEERNSQFRRISRSLFSKNRNSFAKHPQITVWLGDLNYRLEGVNTFPARSLIRKNLQEQLTSKDQLIQEAESGKIFSGYSEGTLAFKPTYKYDIGSTNYDTSHKERVPSWTDRILFKIEDEDKINANIHSYESIDNIVSSDHRPVKAHLCLKHV